MTEAFVAFVRFEEKLLLLKRNSSTEHFPDPVSYTHLTLPTSNGV